MAETAAGAALTRRLAEERITAMRSSDHLLLYTDGAEANGVAEYNHALLGALAGRGYRLTCVQTRKDNPLIRRQAELGVRHVWLDFDTDRDFRRSLTNPADAQCIFQAHKPDLVVFSNGCPLSHFAAKEVAVERGLPFLIVEGFAALYLAERFADRVPGLARHYAAARAVIAVSQENLRLLHQRFGLPSGQGTVIYYGRPERFFQPPHAATRQRLRAEWDIPADAVLCLTAARLDPIKGYAYQLEALRLLQQTPLWPRLFFVWAGTGSLADSLPERLRRQEAADHVRLLGQRWDVADWLDAADIYVHPSEAEGMPLAVMEAMAKGLPVAASAVGGIPEELGDTGQLLHVPQADPPAAVQALAETISLWAQDAERRRSAGAACRERALALFREERMLDETIGVIERALLPEGDYVAPGWAVLRPDACFPAMQVGDRRATAWPYLRREVPHPWYVDRRWPAIGWLSRDEAHLLYQSALQFRGQRALEIGCFVGWSTCHLALAGMTVDAVDPLLSRPELAESVRVSLQAAGVLECVHLVAGASPQAVEEMAAREGRRWPLIFIDGDHEGDGPLRDAMVAARFAADDALVLFHDLASPVVARGLEYLRVHGWRTLVYQTMQIMGAAWRGRARPVDHHPDPKVAWTLPEHLRHFPVCNAPVPATADRPAPLTSGYNRSPERQRRGRPVAGAPGFSDVCSVETMAWVAGAESSKPRQYRAGASRTQPRPPGSLDFNGASDVLQPLLTLDPPPVRQEHPMTTVADALQEIGRLHQAGDVARAEQLCRQVLEREPDCAEAHFDLANLLTGAGKRAEAVAHYRHGLRFRPDHAEALTGLGVALAEQGALDEAVANLQAATRLKPDLARAHYNLGVALAQQNKFDEATTRLEEALRLQPGYAQAYYALGNVRSSQGKKDEALALYREALRLKPDFADAYNNYGLALAEARRSAEAAVVLRQAVRLLPRGAEAHNNLGLALADLGRFAEAEDCYQEALRLNPRYADAHNNLGSAYKEQGRLEEALASYQLALWLNPDSASTHWNRALALLQKGDFEEGWQEYEWRWQRPKARPRSFPQPAWDGSPPAGRTLLLWMEQGLGDMLMFIRFAELVQQQGATVVVECPRFLHPLFARCRGIDRLVAEGTPLPDFDAHVPLMGLPHRLKTTVAAIPANVPYLFADEERVQRWGQELAGLDGFRIGITWQGNRHHQWDHFRSFPVRHFAALAQVPRVRLISLQKGYGAEQLKPLGNRFAVTELNSEEDAATAAFMDTAAIMQNLDLVITADTAIAHLAGALGVPVWVALSAVTDWRWLRGRDDSPWYPTLRLFRQSRLGDWEGVFSRMATEVQRLVSNERETRSGDS
jgi:tetratricopeptide (TPR) repeat protein/glycosyltransferase involved in cell wall biosynthesis